MSALNPPRDRSDAAAYLLLLLPIFACFCLPPLLLLWVLWRAVRQPREPFDGPLA